jgi:hypothetical protein
MTLLFTFKNKYNPPKNDLSKTAYQVNIPEKKNSTASLNSMFERIKHSGNCNSCSGVK